MKFHILGWLLLATLLLSPVVYAEPLATPSLLPAGGITLDNAVQRALAASPRLKAVEAALRASEGERTQAGLWQNPEIGVEAENFAGSGDYRGYSGAETTVGVSQVIEVSGKRSGRIAVADQSIALARLEQVAERLDVIRDTSRAFTDAVAAEEMLRLAEEQKALALDLHKEVAARVDSAREPLIQKSKAEITLSAATFAHERAEREYSHAKHVLASQWAGHDDRFQLSSADFFTLTPPITEEEAEARMEKNPTLERYRASHGQKQARYELEKAEAIPDPRVSVGLRDFRDNNNQALVAGFSIPLPVLNQNQGGIERARQEISKAESDTEAAKLNLINEMHEALETQVNAYRQAESLKASILPASEKAFKLSREGYRMGRFPYLEVLDAQRTLFQVKEQYITSLKEYHNAKAEVERLTAHDANINEGKHE